VRHLDAARGHRAVAHTVDVRVEAWAPNRETCMAEAVLGTAAAFGDTASAAADGSRRS
jgi:protein archease